MAKLKLPFELEKPSSSEYVTQADQIGYGNGSVKEALDKAVSAAADSTKNTVAIENLNHYIGLDNDCLIGFYIKSDNVWAAYADCSCYIIPISSSDSIIMEGAGTYVYALLSDFELPIVDDTPDFCAGTSRVSASGKVEITAPQDAKYLYVLKHFANNQYNVKIVINDNNFDILGQISTLNTGIDNMQDELNNVQDELNELNGHKITQPSQLNSYALNSNGVMEGESRFKHVVVDVSEFRQEEISSNIGIQYAFLKTYNSEFGSTSEFANGCSRVNGYPTSETIPSDANWLYIYLGYIDVVLPVITVTGEVYGIEDRVEALENDIESINDQLEDLSEEVQSIDDVSDIATKESGTKVQILTQSSTSLTIKEGYYANQWGWSAGANYTSYYFVADSNLQIWVNSNPNVFDLVIYNNGEVSQANYVDRYRASSNTLPTESNKLSVTSGQVVVFCVIESAFSVSVGSNVTLYNLKGNVVLDEEQIKQVEEAIEDKTIPSAMYAEKSSNTLSIYKRNSRGKYIKYTLIHRYKAFTENEYPSFYDNWGLAPVVECTFDGETMHEETTLFRSGEAELAINVPDSSSNANVYVGGAAHGFENIYVNQNNNREIRILVDGVLIGESDTFSLKVVKEIDVKQHSVLCQAYSNTNDFLDAYKNWIMSENEPIKIHTRIVFKKAIDVSYCQMGMFCVLRHLLADASKPYITKRAILESNPFVVYNVEDNWSIPEIMTPNHDCSKISEYGDLGLGFAMSIVEDNRKNNGGMFMATNNSTYNKIYFDAGRSFTSATAEELYATQVWYIN